MNCMYENSRINSNDQQTEVIFLTNNMHASKIKKKFLAWADCCWCDEQGNKLKSFVKVIPTHPL